MIDFSKFSVLMVDDVPTNLLLVKRMLSQFNFKVTTATNGLEALDAIKEEKPDLILLDILMPVMDGFDFLKILRADSRMDDVKVIILSALNSNEDIVRGFNLGANDFITKPIVMEKLIASVATQLRLHG